MLDIYLIVKGFNPSPILSCKYWSCRGRRGFLSGVVAVGERVSEHSPELVQLEHLPDLNLPLGLGFTTRLKWELFGPLDSFVH
jgi:hypothetical protein